MEIYKPIVLQVISVLFLVVYFLFSKLQKTNLFKFVFMLLLLLLLLIVFINRDYTANIDLPNYMKFYDFNKNFVDIFTSQTAWKGDFLFFAIMPLSHLIGFDNENYITFQLIISISLTFLAYFYFFKEYKSLMFLGLFFMVNSSSFYLIHGNVIRQGLASSLLLMSLSSNTNTRINLFKISAFFSHKGSLFSFFTRFFDTTNKTKLLIMVLAFLIGYFSVFIHLLNIFPLPVFIKQKIDFYSNFQRASTNSQIKLSILLIFNFLFLYLRSKENKYEHAYRFFFAFSIASFLLFRFDGMFSRLILYTDIFIPIIVIGSIQNLKSIRNKIIVSYITIIISIAYSLYVFNHKSIIFNMGEKLVLF
ncbi:EpsG family protein [Aquimarina hainanensis]|uniref:EpsG family protein n=1 Tax=Aquimarina hainanensis TaxID=1578017 RepID=A0ABW5N5L5_9FLAO